MPNVIRILERNKYLLDDGKTLEVTADKFKLDIHSHLGTPKYKKSDKTIAKRTDASILSDIKTTAKDLIKDSCNNIIRKTYDYWKQFNINELQDHTQQEKDDMWTFINSKREWYDNKKIEIDACSTIDNLKAVDLVCK